MRPPRQFSAFPWVRCARACSSACSMMIRLTPPDLEDPERVRLLARSGALDEAAFLERFTDLVKLGR